MQSEKFDKRTREAAENHHPTYDEQAWDKMEKLLDKHLPQKEDRKRRFIFFLLLFLLLGGGSVWLFSTKPWDRPTLTGRNATTPVAKQPAGGEQEKTTITPANDNTRPRIPAHPSDNARKVEEPVAGGEDAVPPTRETRQEPLTPTTTTVAATTSPEANSTKAIDRRDRKNTVQKQRTGARETKAAGRNGIARKDNTTTLPRQDNPTGDMPSVTAKKDVVNPASEEGKPVATVQPVPASPADQPATANAAPEKAPVATTKTTTPQDNVKEIAKQEQEKEGERTDSVAAPVAKKKAPADKKRNSLMFTVSAGPDVSVVGSNKPGRTRLVTGLGLSYTIRERFTVSTGFYAARKIYSAQPADYKAPPEFYQAYPYLEKVDANCRVYEIPISVAYNFGRRGKQSWFVSAGLSTFLMNEEGYNYFYKYTPTGNTYTNFWKVKNENSHYFSIGTFSAGYRRQLGNRVSVMAEPYVKVPFSGVGYGKVKLNSGGVLFSVGVRLF